MSDIHWINKKFNELTVAELYDILKLRSEVFVVEQNCIYPDLDDKDQPSYHLCGWLNNSLVAYARILPPGLSYAEASIGRVSTARSYRKNGAGKVLMQKAIGITLKMFKDSGIKIGAQLYLDKFYISLGFKQSGPTYLEDGIPHIEMEYLK